MFSIIQTSPILGYTEYGVLGMTIVMLSYAVIKLYSDNVALRDKMDTVFRNNAEILSNLSITIREEKQALCAAIAHLTEQLDIAKRLENLEHRGRDG